MPTAPIAFFAYNRPKHTLKSLQSLAENHGADQSELFIFCDGAKCTEDQDNVNQVRQIVKSKQWCNKVHIIEQEINLGLSQSIILGVTNLCEKYHQVIVIEDDLALSPYFLDFMNKSLELYRDYNQVMQISGYMFPVQLEVEADATFLPFTTSWGWATWQSAWKHFDLRILNYNKLKTNKKLRYKFNLNGSYPYFEMLENQLNGLIDSWAIRWYLSVFMLEGVTLYPVTSLVRNLGFDGSGSHCGNVTEDIDSDLSTLPISIFPDLDPKNIEEDKNIIIKYLKGKNSNFKRRDLLSSLRLKTLAF